MDWEQHSDEVGEYKALTDLRHDMYPITTKRVLPMNSGEGLVAALRSIHRRYGEFPDSHFEDYSIKAHCTLIMLPKQRRRIRDWWLVLHTDVVQTDVRAVRIVFAASRDEETPTGIYGLLAARVTYRLHKHWTRLTTRASDHTSLTQEVNRQVISTMWGVSRDLLYETTSISHRS